MPMPTSANGGTWLSGDTIGKGAMNLKTNLVIPSGTYTPVIGTDTVAGMFYIDTYTGMIRVMNSSNTVWNVVETSYLTRDPIGFAVVVGATANYVNPDTTCTIAFTNATRTFTITPTGANFKVYIQGLEYVFTTAQNVTITNSEGLWFIYIDATGTIIASQTYWDLSAVAAVAYVYWDVTDSQCIFFADERHMITMDWRTHQYLHNTIGCRYASGLAISGYTLNTSGDSNVEVGFSNGICYDEDLEFLISNGVSGTPASTPNFYNMPLTKPATIPVFYQIGNTGVWRKHSTTNFYLYPDSNPRPYYNLLTGSTWSLASTPSGDYVSYWIFASNDIDNPIIAIMGQQINTTLTNAVNNDVYSALSIASSGLPFVEMKLLYQIILSVSNAYGGSTSSRVAQVNDFRSASLIGGVAPSVGNFITSVDPSYFTVSAGALSFAGVHAQAIGSGDSPSFTGLTVGSNTGIATLTSGVLGSESTVTTTQLGTAVTPATLSGSGAVPAGWTIPFSQVSSIGNIVSSLTTESGAGITLTATNPTGQGAAYYVPSITGNLVIGSYGITFTAIADASVSGKLFLSSTTANVMKYYDNTPALHSIAVLDLAQSFSGIQTFTAKPVINISGSGSVLDLYNPANTHYYTLTTGAIGGNYALNLPVITGADTLAVLGLAQTFSTQQTFGAGIALSNSQAIAFGTGGTITFTDHTAIIGTSSNYVATAYFNNITFEGGSAQLAGTYEIAGSPTVYSTLAFNGTALNIGAAGAYPAIVYTNALTGEGTTPTITGFNLAGTYNIGGTPTVTVNLAVNGTTLVLGSSTNYFATGYFNALTGEGTTPTITGFSLAGTYNIGGTPTVTASVAVSGTSLNLGAAGAYFANIYGNVFTFEGGSAGLAGTYNIGGTPTVSVNLAVNGTTLVLGSSTNYFATGYFNALTGEGTTPTITGFSLAGTYNIGGTPTLTAGLALNSQTLSGTATFSGVITFTAEPIINISGSGAVLRLYNPANSYYYTLTTGAIAASHALNLPVITADDTIEVLGLAQTISAIKTFTAKPVINVSGSGNVLDLYNPANTYIYTIVTSAIAASYTLTLPLITANDTIDVLGLAQTFSAAKTFGAGLSLSNSQAIAFGTGGSITFTDHTAIIGSASNYVATEYLNALTGEGTTPTITGMSLAGTYNIGGTPTVTANLAVNGTTLVLGSSSAYFATAYFNALTAEGTTPAITGFSLAGTYNIGGTPTVTVNVAVSGTTLNLGGAAAYFALIYAGGLTLEGTPSILWTGTAGAIGSASAYPANIYGNTLTFEGASAALAGTYNIGGSPTLNATLALNSQTLSGAGTFSGAINFTDSGIAVIALTCTPAAFSAPGAAGLTYSTVKINGVTFTDATQTTVTAIHGMGIWLANSTINQSGGAVTITEADTLYIAGAPSAGSSVTITSAYSLYIAGGVAYFGASATFAAGLSVSNSQAIAFGTGGSITFTDHTATIGTSSNYVATLYVNTISFEGTPSINWQGTGTALFAAAVYPSTIYAGGLTLEGTPSILWTGTAGAIGSAAAYPATIYTNALTGEGSTPTITGMSLAGTYNIGGTPTLTVTLALGSQTLSGTPTFSGAVTFTAEPIINISGSGAVLQLWNPANTHYYTLTTGAIGANYVLNIPVITAADTLATLGLAQTFTAIQTIQLAQAELIINSTTSGNQSYIELENSASGYIGYLGIVATAGQLATASVVGDVVLRSNSAGILLATSTTELAYFNQNGNLLVSGTVQIGAVANTTAHAAYVSGATSAQVGYNTSCLRFKDNIVSIEDSSWIYNLRPVEFDWKDPERSKREGRMIGLIAEEVQALYPKICEYEKGELTGLHYEWLAVPMIVEMKKLRDRVKELEGKVNELTNRKV